MKTTQFSAHDWLKHEAHLTAYGHPFQFNECSCLPVAPEEPKMARPTGFLMTHGLDVEFVPVESEEGQAMVHFWERVRFVGVFEELDPTPTEYWIG